MHGFVKVLCLFVLATDFLVNIDTCLIYRHLLILSWLKFCPSKSPKCFERRREGDQERIWRQFEKPISLSALLNFTLLWGVGGFSLWIFHGTSLLCLEKIDFIFSIKFLCSSLWMILKIVLPHQPKRLIFLFFSIVEKSRLNFLGRKCCKSV